MAMHGISTVIFPHLSQFVVYRIPQLSLNLIYVSQLFDFFLFSSLLFFCLSCAGSLLQEIEWEFGIGHSRGGLSMTNM